MLAALISPCKTAEKRKSFPKMLFAHILPVIVHLFAFTRLQIFFNFYFFLNYFIFFYIFCLCENFLRYRKRKKILKKNFSFFSPSILTSPSIISYYIDIFFKTNSKLLYDLIEFLLFHLTT